MAEARTIPPAVKAPTIKPANVKYRVGEVTKMGLMGLIWFCYLINFLINIVGDWIAGIGAIVSAIFMIGVILVFALIFAFNSVYIFNWELLKPLAWHFIIAVIPILNMVPLPDFGSKKQTVPLPTMVSMVRRIIEITREADEKKQRKIESSQTAKQMAKMEVRSKVEAMKQSRLQREEEQMQMEMASREEEEML